MPFSATASGFDEQGRRVQRIITGIENPDPLLASLAVELADLWRMNIDAGPNDRWEAGPSRRALTQSGTTLKDKALMYRSITGVVSAPREVTVGSALTVGEKGWNLLSIHEFGAPVRAKNSKYLAIGMTAARGQRPGQFTGLFVAPIGGRAFLARRTGKTERSRLELLFVLKTHVRIPRRPTSPYDFQADAMTPAGDQLIRQRVGDYTVSLAA